MMDSETLEGLEALLGQIDIEDEPESEKNNISSGSVFNEIYKPKPLPRYIPKDHVNFEQYVRENCKGLIRILDRNTFHAIQRPIFIFFNHFREKCAYHTVWLDKLYQLALNYGDSIEFIAADMIDMDVMYPGRNPMNFFCRLVRPEAESPKTFAIDGKKRIYEHFDAFKTVENLSEVCKNLLNGNLFPSEPLPQNNKNSLVKKCVHHTYDELILSSSKNILLVINLECCLDFNEPNYENVAVALKDLNLDIVFMLAEKNYIPFEYHAFAYPTILFIPCNDKNNFIYYEGQRHENLLIEFLKQMIQEPEVLQLEQKKLKSRTSQKIVEIKNNFQIEFNALPQFFEQNFENKFKVLDRKILEKLKRIFIIIFMDFSENKCSAHHIQWLNKLYQFAESSYSYLYMVADFKDIDIINTKWSPSNIRNSAQGKPRIYVIDYHKHSYEFGNFDSPAALFYFTSSVESGHYCYSELYDRKYINEKVKVWTANYFNVLLKACQRHIFITFYSSEDENAEKISEILKQIANDVADLNVEIVKYDVQHNYVDLEYAHDNYPVSYFIPKNNKQLNRIYVDKDFNRDQMLDFILRNV